MEFQCVVKNFKLNLSTFRPGELQNFKCSLVMHSHMIRKGQFDFDRFVGKFNGSFVYY